MRPRRTYFNSLTKILSPKTVSGLALALFLGWIAVPKGHAQTATESSSLPAEQVFKNIQAFKGVPASQILPLMQFISGSLGVHCGHCHHQEEAKRDDDGKPQKLMARRMIQMVADINKSAFGGRKVVSCFTCHRGNLNVARPVAYEPELHPDAAEGPENPPAPANAGPSVDQILDKYVTALGGAEAVAKVSSLTQKGTMTEIIQGEKPTTMQFEVLAKATGKYTAITHVKSGDAVAVYNGNSGWFLFSGTRMFLSGGRIWDFSVPYEQLRAMRSDEFEGAQLGDVLLLPAQIKQMITGLRTAGLEKIGDQSTYVVAGRTKNLPAVRLYFSKDSGLLARLIYDIDTPLGPIPHQIDYSDYRNVSGVKVAFQWTSGDIREPRYIFKMSEAQHNVPIDDAKFSKPNVPPTKP